MINVDQDGSESFSDYRTSHSAYINRHKTHLVRCLERRFAQFQGGIDVERLEPFQIVKYVDNQQVNHHFHRFNTKLKTNSLLTFYFSINLILIGSSKEMLQVMVASECRHFSVIFNRIVRWVKQNLSMFALIKHCINNSVTFYLVIKSLPSMEFDSGPCLETASSGII